MNPSHSHAGILTWPCAGFCSCCEFIGVIVSQCPEDIVRQHSLPTPGSHHLWGLESWQQRMSFRCHIYVGTLHLHEFCSLISHEFVLITIHQHKERDLVSSDTCFPATWIGYRQVWRGECRQWERGSALPVRYWARMCVVVQFEKQFCLLSLS